jgi:hypothetical protein
MGKLHIINGDGHKKVVDSNQLNENTNKNYQIDVDLYLSHGYSKVEDMFREIDGSYYSGNK